MSHSDSKQYANLRMPKERDMQASRFDETFVFDIETMGVPDKVRELGKPYPPFEEPKYGNLKDPVKRQLFYEQKQKEWEEGEPAWWEKQHDRAALSPITGRIVAIGYLYPYDDPINKEFSPATNLWDRIEINGLTSCGNRDLEEASILNDFWERFSKTAVSYGHIIGHNVENFDLPFLMKRSWLLGVKISPMVMNGRYFHRNVVDTMKVWCCHEFKETISLGFLSKLLDVGKKLDNYEAVQFAKDWLDGDKDTAEFYLKNDIDITFKCYERLYLP